MNDAASDAMNEVDHPSMAFSLVTSTGGLYLLPRYVDRLRPQSVVTRPLAGKAPRIILALGYSAANRAPLLASLVSRIEELRSEAIAG